MRINFVGSFTTGYVGEVADEVILARELEELGHVVNKIPRDIWKGYIDGQPKQTDWGQYTNNLKADISIICKWHHFTERKYVDKLRLYSHGPVLYWTWDWMQWPQPPQWHYEMAHAADFHLTNDSNSIPLEMDINTVYFPMDVADGRILYGEPSNEVRDVAFFGSCLDQGVRKEFIKYLYDEGFNIEVFSWNWKDWIRFGVPTAKPAVWGEEFSKEVLQSKICLQMSVNDDIPGYWSNRVGKILTVGGFMLARYTRMMELAIGPGADYFRTKEELAEKIKYYLYHEDERRHTAKVGRLIGRNRFTAEARMRDLEVLLKRIIRGVL